MSAQLSVRSLRRGGSGGGTALYSRLEAVGTLTCGEMGTAAGCPWFALLK